MTRWLKAERGFLCSKAARLEGIAMPRIQLKRVYDPVEPGDGTRILVDRLWPRGLTKAAVAATVWLKEIAPSTALRAWFDHSPERWDEFRGRYIAELANNTTQMTKLRDCAQQGDITLLFATRSREMNEAIVLKQYLLQTLVEENTNGD